VLIVAEGLSQVLVQTAAGGRDNAQDYLCRNAAANLGELLESKAVLALARKGVGDLLAHQQQALQVVSAAAPARASKSPFN
jgi:hypothetical protein